MKILIIEDNPSNMKLATDVLNKSRNHSVHGAMDAETGIISAQSELPVLILMDINMPGMDGLTATRLLKGDPLTRHIKIVALTALAMRGDREKAIDAGCDDYLAKPIRYKELLEIVDRIEQELKHA